MNYFLKLPRFEGPLDLLLHLIKLNELDIFDIDIYALTAQYLDFLRLMHFKNIQEAASFIEMAASLVEMKSKKLLPTNEKDSKQTAEDEEFDLQERLITYDLFQKVGNAFSQQISHQSYTVSNSEWQRLEPLYEHIEAKTEGDHLTLIILYEQMLSALNEKRPVSIQAQLEKIPMEQVTNTIRNYLKKLEFILLQKTYKNITSRNELVANIIAMLQLVRDQEAKVYQDKPLGPIWLYSHKMEESQLHQKI